MGHTPGPWRLEFGDTIYAANNPKIIATVENDVPEYEDNASLIEAAPDMLEACKKCAEYLDLVKQNYPDLPGLISGMSAARAAIAKAEGK